MLTTACCLVIGLGLGLYLLSGLFVVTHTHLYHFPLLIARHRKIRGLIGKVSKGRPTTDDVLAAHCGRQCLISIAKVTRKHKSSNRNNFANHPIFLSMRVGLPLTSSFLLEYSFEYLNEYSGSKKLLEQ